MKRTCIGLSAVAVAVAIFSAKAQANLLFDPSLKTPPPGYTTTISPPWKFQFNKPDGTSPSGRFADESFANNPGGDPNSHGLWAISFEGMQDPNNDPSANFRLSQIVGSSSGGALLGTVSVDLNPLSANDSTWRQYSVMGAAPAGTTAVRVFAEMVDGVDSGFNPQSALLDDFDLTESAGIYTLSVWFKEETFYTSAATLLGIDFLGVPEPTTLALAGFGLLAVIGGRRRT